MDSRVLFINAAMKDNKNARPTADYLMTLASGLAINFPQVDDSGNYARTAVPGCTKIPMNMAVDLTSMKIVYSKCGSFSMSEVESWILKYFGY